MKKFLLPNLCLTAILFFNVSCSPESELNENTQNIDLNLSQQTDWSMANEILFLINEHRLGKGLPKIITDNHLASAYAVNHTIYMIDKGEINHDDFNIRSTALIAAGAQIVGENVAYGYGTSVEVVNAWLNSLPHKTIIEGNYNYSGFGILKNDEDTYYFTMLFYKK